MKPFKKFLMALDAKCLSVEWNGWQSGHAEGYTNLRGSFVAFETIIKGFEIKIVNHDYTPPHHYKPSSVFSRRGLSFKVSKWLEISVTDRNVRYGRKSVIPRVVLLESHLEYKLLNKIFEKVKAKNVIFTPHSVDRLSTERCLVEMSKDISI